jgi:isoleucyl-tRNA synthetase
MELPAANGSVTLEPADVVVHHRGPDGWSGVADRATQVAVDARVTESLAREGMAREVVRHIQDQRKAADLQIEDRITVYLGTPSELLRQAIGEHRDYIAAETLSVRWSSAPLQGSAHAATVKVDGYELTIQLRQQLRECKA